MRGIVFSLLFVNTIATQAQSIKWYDGSVVLATGRVIVGRVAVEPAHDVLLVEQKDGRTVYPAHKIKSFYYYDNLFDINRRYISYRDNSNLYNRYQIFEIVVEGEVSVIRRQKTVSSKLSDALDFVYYVTYKDEVIPLRKFGKKVYPHLIESMETLDEYVSSNHLREYDGSNSIRIIQYYNRSLRGEMITAKH